MEQIRVEASRLAQVIGDLLRGTAWAEVAAGAGRS
jgi:hypothetical protein